MLHEGVRGGRRARPAPVLSAEVILAVDELRQQRRELWLRQREESARLRVVVPAVIAAGYTQRGAAKLLGISYATVQIILRGGRAGKQKR